MPSNFVPSMPSESRHIYESVAQDDTSCDEVLNKGSTWTLGTRRYRWHLLVAVFFLVAAVFTIIYVPQDLASPREFAPQMPISKGAVVFEEDPLWATVDSPESTAAWESLMVPGLGYIAIDHPKKWNLEPGVPTSKTDVEKFSVSMYHQLHCLAMIRKIHYSPPVSKSLSLSDQKSQTSQRAFHLSHCFDYLRQSILCSADLTVEWAKVQEDGTRRQVDGWGIPHWQCKDPDVVEEWMEANRARGWRNTTQKGDHGGYAHPR